MVFCDIWSPMSNNVLWCEEMYNSISFAKEVCEKLWKNKKIYFVVITVPADVPTPNGAGTSAGTVLT